MKMEILVSTSFFCPLHIASFMQRADAVVLEAHEHYQKKSYRNRCLMITPQGRKTLSVPLKGGKNNQMPIKDVQISYDENWVVQHLRTLKMSYSQSPFYEYYIHEVEAILNKSHKYLWDLNLETLHFVRKVSQSSGTLMETNDYVKDVDDKIDMRTIKKDVFLGHEMDRYRQPFEAKFGFDPEVSVLDAIFCLGPELSLYLEK